MVNIGLRRDAFSLSPDTPLEFLLVQFSGQYYWLTEPYMQDKIYFPLHWLIKFVFMNLFAFVKTLYNLINATKIDFIVFFLVKIDIFLKN